MNPTFLEIWTVEGWTKYFLQNAPAKTREFYKFRSACRMAFWIPLTYLTVAMFVSLGV